MNVIASARESGRTRIETVATPSMASSAASQPGRSSAGQRRPRWSAATSDGPSASPGLIVYVAPDRAIPDQIAAIAAPSMACATNPRSSATLRMRSLVRASWASVAASKTRIVRRGGRVGVAEISWYVAT